MKYYNNTIINNFHISWSQTVNPSSVQVVVVVVVYPEKPTLLIIFIEMFLIPVGSDFLQEHEQEVFSPGVDGNIRGQCAVTVN